MENVDSIETLVLSQEDQPGTHRTIRQVSRETGISQTSVHRIIHKELQLKCLKKKQAQDLTNANKIAHLECTKQLLWKYPQRLVQFMWFTDEKLFTLTSPVNLQNDRVHVAVPMRKNKLQPIDCFVLVQISLYPSWFQSGYQVLAVQSSSLSIQGSKLIVHTIVTFYSVALIACY